MTLEMDALLDRFRHALGEAYVVVGADTSKWQRDWMGKYSWTPLCVLRPANTAEVSAVVQACHAAGVAIVPVSGNTGLTGGTNAEGSVMISLDRMNRIRALQGDARVMTVEAGVVLSAIHEAADTVGLSFPLTFGARGSALIGGCLSTNAGGSNVLRYGNTRDLCLGIEVVLPDGRIMDAMGALHKDNSGLNLKHLFIGAEGTLGLITAAVLKLSPAPGAYATAMVALDGLPSALHLLNRLQVQTGGAVEAFEYMPASYMRAHAAHFPEARPAFARIHETNVMVEVASTRPDDVQSSEDGRLPLQAHLEAVLGQMLEDGAVLDANIAQSEAERQQMWARREAAAEVSLGHRPSIDLDMAVPLESVDGFLRAAREAVLDIDSKAEMQVIGHLGDGNLHYTIYPSEDTPARRDALMQAAERVVSEVGGSFSAEHGIGISKLPSMGRLKDPVALDVMRQIKSAIDPKGIMNPGKVLPPAG